MKKLIYTLTILLAFGIIGYFPIVSYAIENIDFSGFQVDIDNLDTFDASQVKDLRKYDVGSDSIYFSNVNVFGVSFDRVTPFLGGRIAYYLFTNSANQNTVRLICNNNGSYYSYSGLKYLYGYNFTQHSNASRQVVITPNIGDYGTSNNTVVYTNIPIFDDEQKAYNYVMNGVYSLSDIKNSDYVGTPSSTNALGTLKNVKYTMNYTTGSKGKYEAVSWGRYSTTGHDLEDGNTLVEFALQDRSTINQKTGYGLGIRSDNTDGTVSLKTNQEILQEIQDGTADAQYQTWNGKATPFIQRVLGLFSEHIYPYGATNRAIAKGYITTAPSYNKMISLGTVNGMQKRFAFNGLQAYTTSINFAQEAPEIHSSLTGVYNTNLPNFLKGGFIESVVSNSNYYNIADYNLSYNIYARIVKGSTKGVWLLIDKHGNAIGPADPRPRGGITKRPVILPNNYEPTNDFTDAPEPEPAPPADDNDDGVDDNEDNDPLGVEETDDDLENPTGNGTTNVYNNYTYNYDNRSWIENHYSNEDVSEVNEGIEWIKLFGRFFGIFNTLFGAFLPDWCVNLVTVATPIAIGLVVFRIIKGVIPFV